MPELPRISVVIPCLNRAYFLTPTIESVLQQDYPHIECIVIDGGSTDDTLEILKDYGERIRWVSEPDHGHADAINKGWKMSTGDILAWLNADDVWGIPSAVSYVVAYLREHPEVDVVYGDCGQIDVDGNVVGMTYLREWNLEYAVEYCDHCIPQPAAFIRRRILEQVGWLDVNFISKKDHELWLRIGLQGNICYLPFLLAYERACPGYLAQRGDITAAACVALTKKFFTLPNIPENIKKSKKQVFSNAYLRGVDYAWTDGRHWSTIIKYTLKAIIFAPSNIRRALVHFKTYAEMGAPRDARLRWMLAAFTLFLAPLRTWRQVQSALQAKPPTLENALSKRDVEWSWIASHIPSGPGKALEFESNDTYPGLIAAQRGFTVTAVNLEATHRPYLHPQLYFVLGNILTLPLPIDQFDLVISCWTCGATKEYPDRDLKVMARMRELMKSGGRMILTIPVGLDMVFKPMCRVYGMQQLPRLLEGYEVEKEMFWIKDEQNRWIVTEKENALNFEVSSNSGNRLQDIRALGCFVLKK